MSGEAAMSGDAPLSNATNANAPDGQMNDQEMPTTDGQMASNTSEESIPPRSPRDDAAGDEPNAEDPNGRESAGDTLAPGGAPGAAGLGGNGVRSGVLSGDDDRSPDADPGANSDLTGDTATGSVDDTDPVDDTDTAADGEPLEGTTGGLA